MKTFTPRIAQPLTYLITMMLVLTSVLSFAGDGDGTPAKKVKSRSLKINGVVVDDNGTNVNEVYIDVLENGEMIDHMISNENGTYGMKITDQSQYSVHIHKECYIVENVEIQEESNDSGTKVYGYVIKIVMVQLAEEGSEECYDMPDPEPVAQIDLHQPKK